MLQEFAQPGYFPASPQLRYLTSPQCSSAARVHTPSLFLVVVATGRTTLVLFQHHLKLAGALLLRFCRPPTFRSWHKPTHCPGNPDNDIAGVLHNYMVWRFQPPVGKAAVFRLHMMSKRQWMGDDNDFLLQQLIRGDKLADAAALTWDAFMRHSQPSA